MYEQKGADSMSDNIRNNEDLLKRIAKLEDEVKKLRRQNRELKHLNTNLSEAQRLTQDKEITWIYALEGNRDGVWDWNAVTDEVFFSKRWKEMLGYEEDEVANHLSEWEKRLHPDDRDAVYADLNRLLHGETPFYHNEHRLRCKDGSYRWILDRGKIVSWTEDNKPLKVVGTHTDITQRKEIEIENQKLLRELKDALNEVKTLSRLLPICAKCKRIRDDKGYWNQIESYIRDHSDVQFTHGICPECSRELYPELFDNNKK